MALTIPAAWTTASSCLTSSDVWHWDDGTTDIDVFGPPDKTSSCYPPSFTPTLGFTYAANSCPDGFTPACTTDYYATSWSTICCPSGSYDFSCAFASFSTWTWGCSSSYTTSTVIAATGVSLGAETTTTGALYAATRASGDQLVAYGVGISSTKASTTSTTASITNPSTASSPTSAGAGSTPEATSASSSSGTLSAGASAGIGVGVGLGVILAALAGWTLYRRVQGKKRAAAGGPQSGADGEFPASSKSELNPSRNPSELQGAEAGHELDGSRGGAELDGSRGGAELHAHPRAPSELPGSHASPLGRHELA